MTVEVGGTGAMNELQIYWKKNLLLFGQYLFPPVSSKYLFSMLGIPDCYKWDRFKVLWRLKGGRAHKLYGAVGMDVCFLDGHVASEDGDVASVDGRVS